jgi:ABC-type glycerol-3-phosphate transport system permease component
MRNRKRTGWHRYINGINISAFFVVLFVGLPLYWLIASSFKTPANLGDSPPQYFPHPISVGNYTDAFQNNDFGQYFINSLIVTLIATALVLILGTMAGYALGRLPMRGKFTLMVTLLIISVFPAIAVIAPLYLVLRNLGWLNTYQGLIIPRATSAFGIFMLRQFFMSIPREMDEAARIDGANAFTIYWRIILPMSKPALGTLALLHFMNLWNDLLWPLVVTSDTNMRTLPAGLTLFGGQHVIDHAVLFAGATISVIPLAVAFMFAQRFFVQSVATTGIK